MSYYASTNFYVTSTQTHHLTQTLNAVAITFLALYSHFFCFFFADPERCGDYLARSLSNHIPPSGPEREREREREKEREREREREREKERERASARERERRKERARERGRNRRVLLFV